MSIITPGWNQPIFLCSTFWCIFFKPFNWHVTDSQPLQLQRYTVFLWKALNSSKLDMLLVSVAVLLKYVTLKVIPYLFAMGLFISCCHCTLYMRIYKNTFLRCMHCIGGNFGFQKAIWEMRDFKEGGISNWFKIFDSLKWQPINSKECKGLKERPITTVWWMKLKENSLN